MDGLELIKRELFKSVMSDVKKGLDALEIGSLEEITKLKGRVAALEAKTVLVASSVVTEATSSQGS